MKEGETMVHAMIYECPNCGHRQDHPGPCDNCGREVR